MSRVDYWNQAYFEYWKARTAEAEVKDTSTIVKGDARTTDKAIYHRLIDKLDIRQSDTVLEIGCGLGRSFDYLLTKSNHIVGVDISIEMVRQCRAEYAGHVKGLLVAEAEFLPLEDDRFDKIVCFAVFDALYQKTALLEINRSLKTGGKVLITGKNDDYHDDDALALTAEINSRKKGHPNSFTDVTKLRATADHFGFQVINEFLFEWRGDFAKGVFLTEETPEKKFYEYGLILQKTGARVAAGGDCDIASDKSKTFLRSLENV